MVDAGTVTHKIDEDRLDKENESWEENLHQTMIINDFEKISVNISTTVMEQWSRVSNVNYMFSTIKTV